MFESEPVNSDLSLILSASVDAANFLVVSICLKIKLMYQIPIKINVDLSVFSLYFDLFDAKLSTKH